jgi:hypothetical protein
MFVMNGRRVLRELDREDTMTLRELMDRGVREVRRLEWPFPNDHLVLPLRGDGTYGPIGELRSLAAPEALGFPASSQVVLVSLLDTDRWEPYAPKV